MYTYLKQKKKLKVLKSRDICLVVLDNFHHCPSVCVRDRGERERGEREGKKGEREREVYDLPVSAFIGSRVELFYLDCNIHNVALLMTILLLREEKK